MTGLVRPLLRGKPIEILKMPAKLVLQFNCERCQRVWYSEEEQEIKRESELKILVDGEERLSYNILCTGCRKTVFDALEIIMKKIKQRAPIRAKKEGKD